VLTALWSELIHWLNENRSTIQTTLTLAAAAIYVLYQRFKKQNTHKIKHIAAQLQSSSAPSSLAAVLSSPPDENASMYSDVATVALKKAAMVSPVAKPLVLSCDSIPIEGEDSELKDICRWQTLLGADSSKSDSLTVGVATVFPNCPPSSHAHTHDEIYYIISGGEHTI